MNEVMDKVADYSGPLNISDWYGNRKLRRELAKAYRLAEKAGDHKGAEQMWVRNQAMAEVDQQIKTINEEIRNQSSEIIVTDEFGEEE